MQKIKSVKILYHFQVLDEIKADNNVYCINMLDPVHMIQGNTIGRQILVLNKLPVYKLFELIKLADQNEDNYTFWTIETVEEPKKEEIKDGK